MIVDKLAHIGRYRGISDALDQAIGAIQSIDWRQCPAPGRYEIAGGDSYYTVQRPAYSMDGRWERHRDRLDVQMSLSGDERCDYLPVDEIAYWEAYDADRDICFSSDSQRGVRLTLRKGWFVIFFPQDAHKPCMPSGEAATGLKVVFKVKA